MLTCKKRWDAVAQTLPGKQTMVTCKKRCQPVAQTMPECEVYYASRLLSSQTESRPPARQEPGDRERGYALGFLQS